MARVNRKRTVPASREDVWRLIADPYSLPRWWPRTMRVEGVEGEGQGAQWTKVLGTSEGRSVRADFHCTVATEPERFGWEQDIEGTPFERHLKHYAVEASLADAGEGTEVTLAASQTLRGMSRLGSPMMRRGQGGLLEEALEGLERALA
ncbi:MAG TPA: SRPBCC family protein [Solirubrobacterales bacterium]|nr:SRPBCC family protein [Solirubrobacterales bacterium]